MARKKTKNAEPEEWRPGAEAEDAREETAEAGRRIRYIPVDALKEHPRNVRQDVGDIRELADSVRQQGILQNLTVVPDPDDEGTYLVVIGNRRLAAARMAGLGAVPCVVREMTGLEQQSVMLMENMQRRSLTPYEESCGMQLCLDLGMTEEELVKKTGLSRKTVRSRLKIQELDPDLARKKSMESSVTISDFVRLEKIEDPDKRNEVLASAGTPSFGINLAKEEERQKNRKKYAKLLTWVTTFAEVAEINYRKMEYFRSYSEPLEKIPPVENGTKYYISKFDRDKDGADHASLTVYKTRYGAAGCPEEDPDKAEAERKRIEQEMEMEEWVARANALEKAMFTARWEFMTTSMSRHHLSAVDFNRNVLAVLTTSMENCDACRYPRWLSIVGLDQYNRLRTGRGQPEVRDKAAVFNEAGLVSVPPFGPQAIEDLLYLKMEPWLWDRRDQTICVDTGSGRPAWYREQAEGRLRVCYGLLEAMGYSMSDEERAVLNGSHSIYGEKPEWMLPKT